MDELNSSLQEFVLAHWLRILLISVGTIGTTCLTYFFAWRAWRKRQDRSIFHISQNTVEDRPTGPNGQTQKWLILDVISENPLEHDITHPVAQRIIRRAASNTTADQPFLDFSPTDRWYILNIVRLAIAETCKVATIAKLARDQGVRVVTVTCVFAVTYERYAGMKQRKLRVMLVPKQYLDDPTALQGEFRYEAEHHADRLRTLQMMQTDYLSKTASRYCMQVRLNVSAPIS